MHSAHDQLGRMHRGTHGAKNSYFLRVFSPVSWVSRNYILRSQMLLSRSFYSPYNTDVLSEADFSHASLNKTSWMKKKILFLKFGIHMRMAKWPECKTEIKTAVLNNPYYLKLLFLENSFDEYHENFDITITMVKVIMKMLKNIIKVDWTFNLSSWLHFLGFYRLNTQ